MPARCPLPMLPSARCSRPSATADRFDRRSVRDLIDAEAIRVLMPEEPKAVSAALDLVAPGAVLLDAALQGQVRIGLVALDDLAVTSEHPALRAELGRAVEGLRAMWGHVTSLAEIPGVQAGREVHRSAGLDPERSVPRSEALLAHALAERPVVGRDALEEAMCLSALRVRLPMAVHDRDRGLGAPILVRSGVPGEALEGSDGRRVVVEGRPVLCDPDGPFGSLLGDARRSAAGSETSRALVVIYVPQSLDRAGRRGNCSMASPAPSVRTAADAPLHVWLSDSRSLALGPTFPSGPSARNSVSSRPCG